MSQNTSPGCRAVTEQSTYRLTQNGLCLVTLEQVSENLLRDPTDVLILGTALAGQADILCTRHADLLAEDIRQCCATKGVRAVTDLEVLKTF